MKHYYSKGQVGECDGTHSRLACSVPLPDWYERVWVEKKNSFQPLEVCSIVLLCEVFPYLITRKFLKSARFFQRTHRDLFSTKQRAKSEALRPRSSSDLLVFVFFVWKHALASVTCRVRVSKSVLCLYFSIVIYRRYSARNILWKIYSSCRHQGKRVNIFECCIYYGYRSIFMS